MQVEMTVALVSSGAMHFSLKQTVIQPDQQVLPLVSGRKKMQKMAPPSWQTEKRMYTPYSIVQSMVRKHWPMIALLIMDMKTVTPWPRHRVSSGCISEEITHPAAVPSISTYDSGMLLLETFKIAIALLLL